MSSEKKNRRDGVYLPPATLRYPEARSKLKRGAYNIDMPGGATLIYKKGFGPTHWQVKPKAGAAVRIAAVDDLGPPDGVMVMNYEQALDATLDFCDGLEPLDGAARRELPTDFLKTVWEVSGVLVAADRMDSGGFGFIWHNSRELVDLGAKTWPYWIWFLEVDDRERIARLAGKVCAQSIDGPGLNERESDAMRAALIAAGEDFDESEYQQARGLLENSYKDLRAVVRNALRQCRDFQPYRVGPLIGLKACEENINYAAVYDMGDGAISAACVHPPRNLYPEFTPTPYVRVKK